MKKRVNEVIVQVLAGLLIAGGLLGVGLGIYMGFRFAREHWLYLVLIVAFAGVFVWTALTGVRLWRGDARGWKWAKILYAAQIPIITVPGFSYEYYVGAAIKVLGGRVNDHLAFALGATGNFYLDTRITGLVYGVNLVALAAFIYLLTRSKPASTDGA